MKRRWLRLLIAYLIAGYLGCFLTAVTDSGWHRAFTAILEGPGICISFPLLWPLVVLIISGDGHNAEVMRLCCLYCYSIGIVSYCVLSFFVPKPNLRGLCAACGYDLRATPERCPECGTVVKQQHEAAR